MLSLTRKLGQQIRIDDDIVITVGEVNGSPGNWRVKLLIEAPRHIPIFREELHQAKKDQPAKEGNAA